MKKLSSLMLLTLFSFNSQADFESSVEYIKERIEDVKCQIRYYTPYAIGSTVSWGSFSVGKNFGASVCAMLGIYSLYAGYKGFQEIKLIEKKYKVNTKSADYWNNFYGEEKFLFCRWRQQDDRYEDGFYWPTAWLCNEERQEVRKKFIQDIHAQRIEIYSNGKKIVSPKPSEVVTALNREMSELEQDKKRLQAYTNIWRMVERPEEFHPDVTYKRFFWPNYNRASKLYIEVVQMMMRLEVLRDIIAQIRSGITTDKWPKA